MGGGLVRGQGDTADEHAEVAEEFVHLVEGAGIDRCCVLQWQRLLRDAGFGLADAVPEPRDLGLQFGRPCLEGREGGTFGDRADDIGLGGLGLGQLGLEAGEIGIERATGGIRALGLTLSGAGPRWSRIGCAQAWASAPGAMRCPKARSKVSDRRDQ